MRCLRYSKREPLRAAETKGDSGILLAKEIEIYSLFDLQIIGGQAQ